MNTTGSLFRSLCLHTPCHHRRDHHHHRHQYPLPCPQQQQQLSPFWFFTHCVHCLCCLSHASSSSHNLSPLFFLHTPQQKNTCAHNSTHKAHANGIKKAKRTKFVSTRGMDPKFLRNQKFAKKYNGSKRVHDDE
eukprot:Nitzschia sp. Nitz4//scaffold261_size27179//9339//9740//NITZ4_008208-RA/size27179-exonerate_protein2genome-gene-0.16-mRNA-1//-1//CDS//3329544714//2395//frame0